jgi:hypothetical protein
MRSCPSHLSLLFWNIGPAISLVPRSTPARAGPSCLHVLALSVTLRLDEWCENDSWLTRTGGSGVRPRRRFDELSSQIVNPGEIRYISDLQLIDGDSHATGEPMCETLHHFFRWFTSELGQLA